MKCILRLFIIILTVTFQFGSLDCNAQKLVVKGKIFDNYKNPLPNACISITNSNKKTFSDSIGNYVIKCKYGDNFYVNYNNQLVENVKVLHDTLNVTLHIAQELCWDGFAYDNYISIIPSVIYNSNFNYSIDLRYSFSNTNSFKQIFDFGVRYLSNEKASDQHLIYVYTNLRSPYFKNFIIKYLNPYIDIGYFNLRESGKENYYNLGYGFGLSFPKKYFRWANFQLNIGYSKYIMKPTENFLTLGLSIGLTSSHGIGGSEFY